MNIIFTGGGTAGSVIPLLSIYSEIRNKELDASFLFIGTVKSEPEVSLLRGYSIKYTSIYCGKLRRYFDFKNVSDIFLTIIGFSQSLYKIYKFKADVVVGAGGYVSVPVIWAGWILRKKIIIHQQDIRPSLSNILTKNMADRITVTFERSLRDYPSVKTVWTGNPVRSDIMQGDKERAYQTLKLKKSLPVILVVGGGTGATSLNLIVNQALPEITKFSQVIHLTGKGKRINSTVSGNYQQHEFLNEEMGDALAVADIVISRAGLSAITEFSILSKPAILIPLPKSHQELNAEYYGDKKAAVIIKQKDLSPKILVSKLRDMLNDKQALSLLSSNISGIMKPDAAKKIADEIINLI
ncbi:undecaprenyldiphospho-muramoylpentapeptide beta-N-acetylglucosaminyltransferase [Patescibacteria group bacterium]|nr:undecaprenyldiphospho-muramoylpentapeptide beta-N-acetylglucosaminyltransferase [Patescibacteria group bacterium]MBU0964640.1 undecaprenyldiphospho-muramoylpentapeptide beta-N-acetylglucosaminyltransferase [Patescibacteria group bacterium]